MHVNIYFLAALAGVLVVIFEAFRIYRDHHDESVMESIEHAIAPIKTELAVMVSQVTTLWRWRESVILDQLAILHHPEESRLRVDELLDAVRDGSVTVEQATELKDYLQAIIDHDQVHNPAPFTVFPGEQTAASMLLHALDTVIPEE